MDRGPPLAEHLQERYGSIDDVLRDAAEFRSAISSRYLSRKQSDVLTELLPLTLVDVPVELGGEEVLDYKEAVNTGHLPPMRIAVSLSPSKLAALQTIADEAKSAGRKMLVFSEYLEVLGRGGGRHRDSVLGYGLRITLASLGLIDCRTAKQTLRQYPRGYHERVRTGAAHGRK